jgi:RluA family pseudouridine synthase
MQFQPADLLPTLLYQDESLLCIHKPAGLLSIPDGYNPEAPHVIKLLAPEFGRLWIVHRLDRETSGVMILARSALAHRELNRQFEHHDIQKIYYALTAGQPDWETIYVDLPLRVNGDRKHRTVVSSLIGKPARTDFKILRRFRSACWIEARPHSGYTHQIRAHLTAIGCPILGDALYRNANYQTGLALDAQLLAEPPIQRVALHAFSIAFGHPITFIPMSIEDPLPQDFQQALDFLAKT